MKISIISPVYKAEKILSTLVDEINKAMRILQVEYEIILVDDRSPDNSWAEMQSLSKKFDNLNVYRLSRNFGQHPTIMAGLSKAKGEWIVVMDCDMQDQPKEIVKLYQKAIEGYDVVQAKRVHRQDGFFKKLTSKVFYKSFNYLAGIQLNSEVANFGIYHQKVIKEVLNINDYIKAFPLFVKFVGFKATEIPVEHASRIEGTSTYTFSKLFSLAFDIVVSYSDKPLKLFVYTGMLFSFSAMIAAIFVLYQKLNNIITIPGYASIILSVWFLSGLIISCLGIIVLYLGKTFNQTKNRPIYIFDNE